jgi:signal transduction histidine kinase
MIEPKPKEVNLRLLVEDTIQEMPTRENVVLETFFDEGLDMVRIDPSLTRRVLENLVVNAGEAMPNGGRVRVRAWREGHNVVLSVADSGVGIPEDVAGKFFTPLFTTKIKGVGLGLSFCKRAVEAQGGTIGFSSRLGEGTTFTVKIPVG